MVSEAAVLGTPGIFISPVSRCYTDDQEVNYNLVKTINPKSFDDIISVIRNWHNGKKFQNIAENHQKLIESKIDVTDFILSSLTAMAKQNLNLNQ
jgi:predicted glycosyltransferase